ncbi:hypothetical protein NC653_018314 [Populus alba x Populus x berolinensis]|uniref:Uncharacterized protein n=1 Tax=Populus alba x Populus x berolinensis TaxID=444605 RepID=A0AAD6QG58_9ROSI|nr:hypothetical protein NC653_018314 [Populus alba x Populus x berolinensis]
MLCFILGGSCNRLLGFIPPVTVHILLESPISHLQIQQRYALHSLGSQDLDSAMRGLLSQKLDEDVECKSRVSDNKL